MDRESREEAIKQWNKKKKGPSQLDKISSTPESLEKKIKELKKKGATEVQNPTMKDLENIEKGYLISYITKDNKYRSGGILTYFEEKYFVLLGGGGNIPKISFSVQFKNVKTIYIRKIEKEKSDDE
jgi:hypothetical protein